MTILNGTVKWFGRSYGYLEGSDNRDYFVHFTNILTPGYKYLEAGEQVSFSPNDNEKGLFATNVEVLSPREEKPSRNFRDNIVQK